MLAMRPIDEKPKDFEYQNEQMSDAELDREWKPTGRPQSQAARAFSVSLDDIFRMDNSLDTISQAVFDKQRTVIQQNRELEALEARLRETEERLKKRQSRSVSPNEMQASAQKWSTGEDEKKEEETPLSSPAEESHGEEKEGEAEKQ